MSAPSEIRPLQRGRKYAHRSIGVKRRRATRRRVREGGTTARQAAFLAPVFSLLALGRRVWRGTLRARQLFLSFPAKRFGCDGARQAIAEWTVAADNAAAENYYLAHTILAMRRVV